eukprot:TRINITY_DN3009_c0_g4_i1.p1 TRINITY_DN3009_c0_g4~~TRINITY_DN3009_c0_g4_i1.p1  ORF type:complete len:238 (+),score=48.44 TRINITY_DN3009_c0_g4_i1:45-758(+)
MSVSLLPSRGRSLGLKEGVRDVKDKELLKEQQKHYRIIHKEAIKFHQQQFYLKNKEAIKLKKRDYYINNCQAIQHQQKQYRLTNKLLIQHHKRNYYKENQLALQQIQREYYHKHKQTHNPSKKLKNMPWSHPGFVWMFFRRAGRMLHVQENLDWYRISREQMGLVGGRSVYATFGNIGKALQWMYPEEEWDQNKFSIRQKKSTQRWLRVMLQQILPPKTLIFEDFLHPDLLWGIHIL